MTRSANLDATTLKRQQLALRPKPISERLVAVARKVVGRGPADGTTAKRPDLSSDIVPSVAIHFCALDTPLKAFRCGELKCYLVAAPTGDMKACSFSGIDALAECSSSGGLAVARIQALLIEARTKRRECIDRRRSREHRADEHVPQRDSGRIAGRHAST